MQFVLIDTETEEAILKNMRLAILRIIAVTLKFHRKQLSPVFAHKDFKVCEVYITYFHHTCDTIYSRDCLLFFCTSTSN